MPSLRDLLTGRATERRKQQASEQDCEIEETTARNTELRRRSLSVLEEALAVHERLQEQRGFPLADAVRVRDRG